MTPRWIRDQIEYLAELSCEIPGDPTSADPAIRAGYSPDESVFEESADLVRAVGYLIVGTGWPEAADLYAASRTFGAACAPHHAVEYLARCLPIVEANVADVAEPEAKQPPAHKQLCYQQWKQVMTVQPGIPMMEAHRWYKHHLRESGDKPLPNAETWVRHVSTVRKFLGETKEKSPRHGRQHGSSVVKQKDI